MMQIKSMMIRRSDLSQLDTKRKYKEKKTSYNYSLIHHYYLFIISIRIDLVAKLKCVAFGFLSSLNFKRFINELL